MEAEDTYEVAISDEAIEAQAGTSNANQLLTKLTVAAFAQAVKEARNRP